MKSSRIESVTGHLKREKTAHIESLLSTRIVGDQPLIDLTEEELEIVAEQ
ncbi:MAG: hypothetical protein MJK10_11440 [Pseudomonadales bacterium]|nr:hypothetical protein [Pseudomonadales bacterium]NRA16614.1 hypothetical protein [Oceanospirillaceae bacterium]